MAAPTPVTLSGQGMLRARERQIGNPIQKGPLVDAVKSPFAREVDAWPDALGELRDAGPLHQITLADGQAAFLVTRHEEVRAALGDPRLINPGAESVTTGNGLSDDIEAGLAAGALPLLNPPGHTRIRQLVAKAFTVRQTERLRPKLERIAETLLDAVADHESFDIVEDYAFPLAAEGLAELLGLPREDVPAFRSWSIAYINAPFAAVYPVEEVTAFVEYQRRLIERKREDPDDGLLSELVEVHDEDDGRLTRDELTSLVCLLVAAGFETTAHQISAAVRHLLRAPDEAERLRRNPDALPDAIKGMVRFDSTIATAFPRIAREPVELGGVHIPAGGLLLLSLLSANRDPSVFDDRGSPCAAQAAGGQSVAFGYGTHYCLGAPMAQVELEVALSTLLRRFPDLRLTAAEGDARWQARGFFVRGLAHLSVATR
jgi:cytochrome P450